MKITILFFLLFFYQSFGAMGAPQERITFKISKQDVWHEIGVSITDRAFTHITEGTLKNGVFSGGHVWPNYYRNHVQEDLFANIYFDTNLKSYIVESEKGDSLIDLICKLKSKFFPDYHTLFPGGLITKQFILYSFKRAYLKHYVGQVNSLDYNNNLFYVEYEGFKVAGHFIKEANEYKITTFFPDLKWYYRIDFTHHPDDPFQLDRFMRYHPNPDKNGELSHFWVQHGLAGNQAGSTEIVPHTPFPVAELSLNNKGDEGQLVDLDEFILHEKIDTFLRAKFSLKENIPIIDDILTFLFYDPSNPAIEEIDILVKLLDIFLDEFSVQFKRNMNGKNRLRMVKIELLNRYKNHGIFFKKLKIDHNNKFRRSIKIIGAKNNSKNNYFGENFLRNMLTLNLATYFIAEGQESTFWWYWVSKKFYEKFQNWLLDGSDFASEIQGKSWAFEFVNCNYSWSLDHNHRVSMNILRLVSTKEITVDSLNSCHQPYRLFLSFSSPKSELYKVELSDILFPRLRKP